MAYLRHAYGLEMHGPGTLLRRVPGYRKVMCLRHVPPQPIGCARGYPKSDVPPARTGSANGLCEMISDETEPPARTALANRLCERISEEIVPEARTFPRNLVRDAGACRGQRASLHQPACRRYATASRANVQSLSK